MPTAKATAIEKAVSQTKIKTKREQLAVAPGLTDKLAAKAKAAVAAAPEAGKEKAPRVMPPDFKPPKTLAATADLLYTTRQARLEESKVIKAKENIEGWCRDRLIDELPKGEASGVAGKVCRVSIGSKQVPQVDDWSKLYAAIVANYLSHKKRKTGQEDGAFSLLNRALNAAAVEERWVAGETVDGVKSFPVTTVSVNKL